MDSGRWPLGGKAGGLAIGSGFFCSMVSLHRLNLATSDLRRCGVRGTFLSSDDLRYTSPLRSAGHEGVALSSMVTELKPLCGMASCLMSIDSLHNDEQPSPAEESRHFLRVEAGEGR